MHRDHPWEYRRGPFQRDTFLLRRSGKINDEEFNDEESARKKQEVRLRVRRRRTFRREQIGNNKVTMKEELTL